jgi:hypothetical protein
MEGQENEEVKTPIETTTRSNGGGGINGDGTERDNGGSRTENGDRDGTERDGTGSDGTENRDGTERDGTGTDSQPPRSRKRRSRRSPEFVNPPKQENEETQNLLEVVEVPPIEKKKRGRKPKARSTEEAKETALLIIMIFEGLAITFLSPEAMFNDIERSYIEPPLTRILGRMSPEVIELAEKWVDPIMLIFGLGLWGFRVSQSTPKPEKKPKENLQKQENIPQNGKAVTEDLGFTDPNLLSHFGGFSI